jgi:hypothetical protein
MLCEGGAGWWDSARDGGADLGLHFGDLVYCRKIVVLDAKGQQPWFARLAQRAFWGLFCPCPLLGHKLFAYLQEKELTVRKGATDCSYH